MAANSSPLEQRPPRQYRIGSRFTALADEDDLQEPYEGPPPPQQLKPQPLQQQSPQQPQRQPQTQQQRRLCLQALAEEIADARTQRDRTTEEMERVQRAQAVKPNPALRLRLQALQRRLRRSHARLADLNTASRRHLSEETTERPQESGTAEERPLLQLVRRLFDAVRPVLVNLGIGSPVLAVAESLLLQLLGSLQCL